MLKLQDILMRIESELTDRTLNFEIAVKGLLLELFVCFSRSGEKSNETVFLSPEFKIRMEQILNELTKNYAMPFSAESLAREVNMSRSYMDRLFKEITGCTPNQYLIAYRVNQAKIKLVQTESSVLDIACSVGFGDLSHFYATFKRMTGMTPNQYRTMYFQACSKIGFGKHGI
jgi:AraC-like DNA-binding protein